MTVGDVLAVLHRATGCEPKRNGTGWKSRCPAHGDSDPSLSVKESDRGDVLLCCHAGCSIEKITAAVGLQTRDLFASKSSNGKAHKPRAEIVATYDYLDADGRLMFQVCRKSDKTFPQRRPDGNGGWTWSMDGVHRVLYRLPELLAADPARWVLWGEGEKDTDRLAAEGFVSTTASCGAGEGECKARFTDLTPLHGRRVAVFPDNDNAGRVHAVGVATLLHGKADRVRIIELPGLPEKGDVSDWLDAGHSADELKQIIEAAADFTPGQTITSTSEPVVTVGTFRPRQGYASERFVAEHGETIRYCAAEQTWLAWDGKRWGRDDTGEVFRLAKATVLGVYRAAADEPDEYRRKDIIELARKCDSDNGIRAIVSGAEYLLPVRQSDLDSDPWLLTVANGTLDLRTGELRDHRRDDLITRLADVKYQEDAEHELWDRVVRDATGGDVEIAAFLQRAGIRSAAVHPKRCFSLCTVPPRRARPRSSRRSIR